MSTLTQNESVAYSSTKPQKAISKNKIPGKSDNNLSDNNLVDNLVDNCLSDNNLAVINLPINPDTPTKIYRLMSKLGVLNYYQAYKLKKKTNKLLRNIR